MHNQLESFLRS